MPAELLLKPYGTFRLPFVPPAEGPSVRLQNGPKAHFLFSAASWAESPVGVGCRACLVAPPAPLPTRAMATAGQLCASLQWLSMQFCVGFWHQVLFGTRCFLAPGALALGHFGPWAFWPLGILALGHFGQFWGWGGRAVFRHPWLACAVIPRRLAQGCRGLGPAKAALLKEGGPQSSCKATWCSSAQLLNASGVQTNN
eukprot:gene12437-biopygen1921